MSIVLRAEDEPVTSRFDYWRHVIRETVAPLEFRMLDGPDFRCSVITGDAGPTRITEVDGSAAVVSRTRKLIQHDPELCKIDVMVTGSVTMEQGDQQSQAGQGDFVFVDLTRPCRWNFSPARVVAMVFPKALLPMPSGDVARLAGTRVSGGSGAGALISSLVGQLPRHLGDHGTVGAARLGVAALDVLTVALAARLDQRDAVPQDTRQRALLVSVRRFIEERLADRDLSPATIAAAHHISVRYLYRLFESEETTLAGWIRHRRLERCRHDLLDPALRARPAGSIGTRWGFADPVHFNRVFRSAYGLPPGEYRIAGNGTRPS
jgi:AraC-like DNA-binding protein